MDRRKFIVNAGAAAATGASLVSCADEKQEKSAGPYINFNNTYHWKMTTTWPPNFPIVGEGCKMLADWVRTMSGGRMDITVYGAGELIPAFEGFDAVSNGAVEMNHGAAYYWAGKIPAGQLMSTVPFGLNAQGMDAWILAGGGKELWEELYDPFDLLPISAGNTSVQMGGWFNRAIDSIEDIKGLKMRIPGLGGKVFAKAGGTPQLVAGGEIYTNLERGVIDATEWIGPYHDYLMGFHQVARYYYYPGWHEPGTTLEMTVNKSKFNALPSDLQEIVRSATLRLNRWMSVVFDARNGEYMGKIQAVKDLQIRQFPDSVLQVLKEKTGETIQELIDNEPDAKKIYEAFASFKKQIKPWMEVSDKIFFNEIL